MREERDANTPERRRPKEQDTLAILGHLLLPGGGTVDLLQGRRVTIGSAERCSLRLTGDEVAEEHCAIWSSGEDILIEDLGSETGTFLNGEKVERTILEFGDGIGIGGQTLRLVRTSEAVRLVRLRKAFASARRAAVFVLVLGALGMGGWLLARRLSQQPREEAVQHGARQVSVVSEPDGADIWLDGMYHGRTPAVLKLGKSGEYRLKLEKPGFLVWERKFRAESAEGRVVATLTEVLKGRLVVRGFPRGAAVYCEGTMIGTIPVEARVPCGRHSVIVERRGYESFEGTVEVAQGAAATLHCVLRCEYVEAFRERVRAAPRDARGYFELAQALLTNKEVTEAVACLRIALGMVASERDSADWELSMPEAMLELYLDPPIPGLTPAAMAQFRRHLDEAFAAVTTEYAHLGLLRTFTDILLRSGKGEVAESLCEQAIAKSPGAVGPHLCLSDVYRKTKRYGEAEGVLSLCAASSPPTGDTHLKLAVAWSRLGPHSQQARLQAKAALDAALAACSSDAERQFFMTEYRDATAAKEEAAAPRQPVQARLVDPAWLSERARRELGAADLGAEGARIEGTLKTDSADHNALSRLAKVHAAQGHLDRASAFLEKALRIRPYHSRDKWWLAACLLCQGESRGVGLLLAAAQHSNAVSFNHIEPGDVSALLDQIAERGARNRIAADMQEALSTNTFRAGRTRASILADAAKYGTVVWTRRQPDDKNRLWLMMKDRFLVLFDEAKHGFQDHSPLVRPYGLDHANVTSLVITPTHVLAVADGKVVVLDLAAGRWSVPQLPETAEEAKVEMVEPRAPDCVRVRLRRPDGFASLFLYRPREGRWEIATDRQRLLQTLPADPGLKRFAVARYGALEQMATADAAAAISQWQDVAAYRKQNATASDLGKLLDERGRLPHHALAAVAKAAGSPEGPLHPYFRGITLPGWSAESFGEAEARQAARAVRAAGGDWVSPVVTGYQEDPLSVQVLADPEKTVPLSSVARAVQIAHAEGLKVLLKPHVNLQIEEKDDHMWRGLIRPRGPDDVNAWFHGYRAFLKPFVELSIREKVEMLSVGVELQQMDGFGDHWQKLIAWVRECGYRGKLTYAAMYDSFERVPFWRDLDYVGIDAYFPATANAEADLRQIIAGYKALAARLEAFSKQVGKPIVFTEVGFNNHNGCNTRPSFWSGNRAPIDNLEQAACYHAVLDIFPKQPWLAGMFWWTWEPSGTPMPSDPSYSPQSKLALMVLESYYSSESR
ncbi:MAG TPA: PEGA domain-containing protein [Planctomycetota bacterium]|nr:PEGA domain-containing protein [Planctomycetota bacterium]